jgi:hypothetical protein
MLPSVPVQRKYLVLLNKHFKQVLKASQIPSPSKLTPAQVSIYFNQHFVPKENYYVPKITMDLTPSDDEFMKLALKEPKPKVIKVAKATVAATPAMAPKAKAAAKAPKAKAAAKAKAAPKAKAAAKAPRKPKMPKAAAGPIVQPVMSAMMM